MKRLKAMCVVALVACNATAQKPVYKCTENGKTTYSHAPCPDAEVVDTTPTRGLDKSSGKSRVGADVRREMNQQLMHEHVFRPLIGESLESTKTRYRRVNMSPQDKVRCSVLDVLIPENKGQTLLDLRMEYHRLNC